MIIGGKDAQSIRSDDGRLFRRAVVFSLALHVLGSIVLSVVVRSSADSMPIPEGYLVELVEVAEPIEEVEMPDEGVTTPRGEIRLPEHRRTPRTKPRTRQTREAPRPVRPPQEDPPPVKAETPIQPEVVEEGAGGRMETDVPFPFSYYTEAITRLVLGQWTPLAGAVDSSRVVVRFDIARDGTPRDPTVLRSSGSDVFDRGAIAAVRAVERFPPLPQGFEWDQLRVRFHFEYRRGYR